MTPFVRGALTSARQAGARVIFVTCDPRTELQTFVDLTIAPAVGPEIIAGSTRLKAGTATKLVLNMLTTSAMILIGKTYGNLMVDVKARVGEAARPRPPHRAHRHRPRLRGSREAAEARALEREGRDRDAEDRADLHESASRACGSQTTRIREAIGEDIEPRLRDADRAADSAGPTPASSITVTRGMQLQERRRQLRS